MEMCEKNMGVNNINGAIVLMSKVKLDLSIMTYISKENSDAMARSM